MKIVTKMAMNKASKVQTCPYSDTVGTRLKCHCWQTASQPNIFTVNKTIWNSQKM